MDELKLNEENIQAPFQYLIQENTFQLVPISGEFILKEDDVRVQYYPSQNYFLVDVGTSIDGDIVEHNIQIDNIKIYGIKINNIEDIRDTNIEPNNFGVINNDGNFKSCLVLHKDNLNKKLTFTINSFSSMLSSWVMNIITKKINTLDTNYPIKNYYNKMPYHQYDIIKYKGFLYGVLKDFTGSVDDMPLLANTIKLTPFERITNKSYKLYDVLELNNILYTVQKDFTYTPDSPNIENHLSPLINIIDWNDGITNLYKNTIISKDDKRYIVVKDAGLDSFENHLLNGKIVPLITPKDIILKDHTDLQQTVDRLDTAILDERDNRIESDKELDEKIEITKETITNTKIELQSNIDSIKDGVQGKLVEGDDINLFVKSYNIAEPTFSIDKESPIIMDGDSVDINITTDADFTVNFFGPNLDYNRQGNRITITKKSGSNLDYSGELIFTISKETDKKNTYTTIEKRVYLNSQTYETELNVDNEFIEITEEPKTITATTNATTINATVNDPDLFDVEIIENTKVKITNKVKDLSANTILKITAKAATSNDKTYLSTTKLIYINKAKSTTRELDTISATGTSEAIANRIIKRDEEGSAKINMPTVVDDKSIVNKEYLKAKNIIIDQIGNLLDTNVQGAINSIYKKNVSQDNIISEQSKNIERLNELIADTKTTQTVSLYYIHYPEDNGYFDPRKEPAYYFKHKYNVNTTWKKRFNTQSLFFRTEGTLASADRYSLVQGDAMRGIYGWAEVYADTGLVGNMSNVSGCFKAGGYKNKTIQSSTQGGSYALNFDSSMTVPSAQEVRTRNAIKIIWELTHINGKDIWEGIPLPQIPEELYRSTPTSVKGYLNAYTIVEGIDTSIDYIADYDREYISEFRINPTNDFVFKPIKKGTTQIRLNLKKMYYQDHTLIVTVNIV